MLWMTRRFAEYAAHIGRPYGSSLDREIIVTEAEHTAYDAWLTGYVENLCEYVHGTDVATAGARCENQGRRAHESPAFFRACPEHRGVQPNPAARALLAGYLEGDEYSEDDEVSEAIELAIR
jgi:hypothetical protein